MSAIITILDFLAKLFAFMKGAKYAVVAKDDSGNVSKAGTFWKIFFMAMCPIISVTCFFIIWKLYFFKPDLTSLFDNETRKILTQCGDNSFVSWIEIGTELDSSGVKKDILWFKRVRGCVNSEEYSCITDDIKNHNSQYQGSKDVDLNTMALINSYDNNGLMVVRREKLSIKALNMLQEIKEGSIVKVDDLKTLDQVRKYHTLYNIFTKTNLEMDIIGFTVVKDFTNKVIYVLTLGFAKNAELNCTYPLGDLQEVGRKMSRKTRGEL